MMFRRLSVILGAVALASGVGVGVGVAGADSSSLPPACEVQAGQQGPNEEQATADAVSSAADEVQQEADNPQADDQAGDQQGPDNESNEEGESNQCGDQGDGEQGNSGD